MATIDPLPFRLKLPGRDTVGFDGAWSISYRLEGFLHLDGDTIKLEWVATRWTQGLSFTSVKDEVDQSPIGSTEVPLSSIRRARLRGGWWAPRLQLWARHIDAFEGIPGAQPTTVSFRIDRRDRALAAAIAAALDAS